MKQGGATPSIWLAFAIIPASRTIWLNTPALPSSAPEVVVSSGKKTRYVAHGSPPGLRGKGSCPKARKPLRSSAVGRMRPPRRAFAAAASIS